MSINKVILVGRLGSEPEAKETKNGIGVKFSLATSDSWTDKNTGQKKEKTEWHNVVIWGRLAEVAKQYVHKGDKIYIEGKIETQKYLEKYYTRVVLNGFGSVLEMLESKSSEPRVPVPQAARSPQNDNSQLRDLGNDGQSITPVQTDGFEDKDIPF